MLRKLIPQSAYTRNVITLMTGTGLAQAIPIAVSPILTRLYSPDEFGVFALYLAIASVVSVSVTGGYEFAIMLPKNNRDAMHIVALVIGLSLVVSAVLFLLVLMFNTQISHLLGMDGISTWLYWLPASTLLMGISTSLNYWCTRRGHFRLVSSNRVLQGGSAAVVQMAGGSMNGGAYGLIGGHMAGQAIGCAALSTLIYREDKAFVTRIKMAKVIAYAKKYLNFPKFMVLGRSVDNFALQAPVFMLKAFFTVSSAGFYMLTQRVMGAPISLVSGAVADVFRHEASLAYINSGQCLAIYEKTLKNLLCLAVVPCIVFYFIAPALFSWVFGEQWRIAGEYAQILVPMFFCQFVISPLSSMFLIAEKQKFYSLLQMVYFLSTVLAFVLGSYFSDAKMALRFYSLAYVSVFLVVGFISWKLAAGAWRNK